MNNISLSVWRWVYQYFERRRRLLGIHSVTLGKHAHTSSQWWSIGVRCYPGDEDQCCQKHQVLHVEYLSITGRIRVEFNKVQTNQNVFCCPTLFLFCSNYATCTAYISKNSRHLLEHQQLLRIYRVFLKCIRHIIKRFDEK